MHARHLLLAALLLLVPALSAVEPKKPKKDKDEGPKLLMTLPGKLRLDEPFTKESWAKNWRPYKGMYEIIADQLRVAENVADGHHPEAAFNGPFLDTIVTCRFKFDGCKWMGFSFTDKEHVARIMINAEGFELVKMSGIGATTKGTRLDRMPVKWEKDRWYTMIIELLGNELLAHVDNQYVLYGEAEGMNISKGRIALLNGGQHAWYDELKVVDALPDPKWPKKKPAVLEEKAKRKQ